MVRQQVEKKLEQIEVLVREVCGILEKCGQDPWGETNASSLLGKSGTLTELKRLAYVVELQSSDTETIDKITPDRIPHEGIYMGSTFLRGNLRIDLVYIGEGMDGDYDPDNPDDEPLLRFDVKEYRDGTWEDIPNTSYCTELNVNISEENRRAALRIFMDRIEHAYKNNLSVKRVAQGFSEVSELWLEKQLNK